jgi:hypothetical protein
MVVFIVVWGFYDWQSNLNGLVSSISSATSPEESTRLRIVQVWSLWSSTINWNVFIMMAISNRNQEAEVDTRSLFCQLWARNVYKRKIYVKVFSGNHLKERKLPSEKCRELAPRFSGYWLWCCRKVMKTHISYMEARHSIYALTQIVKESFWIMFIRKSA